MSRYIVAPQFLDLGDAVAADDFVAMRANQVNQAYKMFGQTDNDKPGVKGVGYPRLSGKAAADLIDYWRREASRFYDRDLNRTLVSLFGSPAQFQTWERQVDNLNGPAASIYKSQGLFLGNSLMPDASVTAVWNLIDPVAIGMAAVKATPSQWNMLWEAIQESAADLAQTKPFQVALDLITAVKWAGIGLTAYVIWDAVQGKR